MKQSPTTAKQKPEKDGMQRILLAAVDEFCRAGLAGAKLDVIALEADVSKQLIHHYFRTKAELYIAVINDITAEAIGSLSSPDYEGCAPDEAIKQFLQSAFDLFVRWPFLAGLYNDQGVHGGEHLPECKEFVSRSPALMARLEQVLMRGQQQGDFNQNMDPKASIAAALMVVIGCFTNSPILSSFTPTDFSLKENIEHWREFSVNFVLSALRHK